MGTAYFVASTFSGLLGWFSIRSPEGVRAIYLNLIFMPKSFTDGRIPGPWFFKAGGFVYLFAVTPVLFGLGIHALLGP